MKQVWRILVLVVLACQGMVAVWQGVAAVVSREAGIYANGLTADTDWRKRTVLGAYAEVLDGVAQAIDAEGMILWRESDPMARSNVNLARARLAQRLRHLLYPQWLMSLGREYPVVEAELKVPPGSAVWLLVLDDDPVPAGRAGWTKELAGERYEIWQFQKD